MDSRIGAHLTKSNDNVPFRAELNHVHHTWARTFYSRPALYIKPQTLEEIQKLVHLARHKRQRIVVVGSGHSPSSLTCSSSWMVNLDDYSAVLGVDRDKRIMRVQAGIRLHKLNAKAAMYGFTLPSLGSIDEQSIAGALATGTHGSSLNHGTLASYVTALRIVLSNGAAVRCSPTQNEDLFRAALVSLGALGIVVEVEYQLVEDARIEWTQTSMPLHALLESWERDLWTQAEFVRVWWMPYTRRGIVWRANKTEKPIRPAKEGWLFGMIGRRFYEGLLLLGHYVPRLIPTIEWFVFGLTYGFSSASTKPVSAVEHQRDGLLMDCLYSQYVNEWAIPLEDGPQAIEKLDRWLRRQPVEGMTPMEKPVYVHAPIEVRVSDTSKDKVRGFLEPSSPDGPTLYINATLYRPFGHDPPCRKIYYREFEKLMKSLGGRPHWAKNFSRSVTDVDVAQFYGGSGEGSDIQKWLHVRNKSDPQGLFVGPWHRRLLLNLDRSTPPAGRFECEEREVGMRRMVGDVGGIEFVGTQEDSGRPRSAGSSEESFDMFASAEAAASVVVERAEEGSDDSGEGVGYGWR